jgi:hypothetical protein
VCLSCGILIFSNSLPFSLVMHGLPNCQKRLSHRRTPPPTRKPCCHCRQPALKQFCCPRSAAASLPTVLPPHCLPRCRRHAAAAIARLPPPPPHCRHCRYHRCAAAASAAAPPSRCCCCRRRRAAAAAATNVVFVFIIVTIAVIVTIATASF